MMKLILIPATMLVLLTPVLSYAQQGKQPQPAQQPQQTQPVEEEDLIPPTKYEMFLDTPDAVIVTSSYEIGRLNIRGVESGPVVTANVAWVLNENEKLYAAKIGEVFLDFEELKTLDEGIGKLLNGISESYQKLGAASMSYKTVRGLEINYFTFEASTEALKQQLHLVIGPFSYRGSSTNPLVDLRTLISQARDKLVSLGAK
ncbi:MAG: hypothetical protein J2P31_00415 [Blastocatellia bacterium]|nr:hypothetical protein [Blastocatellia bacterium]